MWAKVKSFLFDDEGAAESSDGKHNLDELHIAATALLVEAAMLDDEFGDDERNAIAGACAKYLKIDGDDVHNIINEAIERQKNAVDIHSFVRRFLPHFNHEERINLLEMLWEVVYADGKLHHYEANLLRRVGGLIGVSDIENGNARKHVLARIDAAANQNK